ncbi:hypothetical protein FRX31_013105 [Thalictrum thalictroides]|uniref:Uncharacterized protein n=1 Tax=Thalictrum thalictroides TaxID=46969 RepID=A0A7J6WK35_THATH|nr:hypothetical protein FRX31_013105 [Thalictrum thalictroides]
MDHKTASGQKRLGTPPLTSKLLTILRIVRFFRSDTPFCCGVYEAVSCLRMPCSSQKLSNSFEQYSPPRSVRRVLIFLPVSFSTSALKLLNAPKASDFSCKKCTHAFLLKSSINETKYFLLPFDIGLSGPHISECTKSSKF